MTNFICISTLVAIFALVRLTYADSNSNFTIDCTQDSLLVKGNTISIAEVIKTAHCWHQTKQIDIFGLSKVIFDDDIDKRDQHVNLSIFAPTWEIISPPNNSQVQRKIIFNAQLGFNFFGISLTKINGEHLQLQIYGNMKRLRKFNIEGKYKFENHAEPSIHIFGIFLHLGGGVNKFSALKLTMIQSNEFDNTKSRNAYREYAKQNFEQTIRNVNLWEFLAEFNMEFNQFNLNELIEDFYGLEDRYSALKDEIDFLPLFNSLRTQLEYFEQQQRTADNDELWKIFHAALISK